MYERCYTDDLLQNIHWPDAQNPDIDWEKSISEIDQLLYAKYGLKWAKSGLSRSRLRRRIKMDDYLKILQKFTNIQEIGEFIIDVLDLRIYYLDRQFERMQDHIGRMMFKYQKETIIWNTINTEQPISAEQKYRNAEQFMQFEGANLLWKNVPNYQFILPPNESAVIDNILNLFSPES